MGEPMKDVQLRVYEELNEFLPLEKRKRPFQFRCAAHLTISAILDAVGIPLSNVDLVLLDGEPADPGAVPDHGGRISVYPVFESFDIAGTTRVRERPLREPRFICDAGMDELAEALRRRGFDAQSGTSMSPESVDACAERESRILITRREPRAAGTSRICRVSDSSVSNQLEEILSRLDLH